jgi:hypothetical protein
MLKTEVGFQQLKVLLLSQVKRYSEIENKILELGGEIPEDENGEEEIKY